VNAKIGTSWEISQAFGDHTVPSNDVNRGRCRLADWERRERKKDWKVSESIDPAIDPRLGVEKALPAAEAFDTG